MDNQVLIPHLFRTEFSKITAVLCKWLGIEHLAAAEDIASDCFLAAAETWPYKGIPENPTAWLYTVARNKASNYLHRNTIFKTKIVSRLQGLPDDTLPEIDLSEKNITDSQLQMLFTICHPAIAPEAQIGLALRVLCGFGIEEIANAFLSNKETINKRLFRAREKLRLEKLAIEFPSGKEIQLRLSTVLTTLYLLFNEGYYSESHDTVLRNDLCLEAMRLTYLLTGYPPTDLPVVHALLALMCFHSSRFEARKGKHDEVILYSDQDDTLWNQELIAKGSYYLHKATKGSTFSKYHIEASIAYWHTRKTNETEKWENILELHNHLVALEYSPVAAMNRAFALSKVKGKAAGIEAAEQLNLTGNLYYYMLLGNLYAEIAPLKARDALEKAYDLAKSIPGKAVILKTLADLNS
jgi:RNA polymerase sigma factor (sigma-70 family)